jgi:transcriptional regulator with PAS, ATPase and Fis domain
MPFIAINCSAIPENLLESELFGHAKGSFTGAIDKKIGLFEEAEGGTLFLDEIGDLSLPLQSKLLRVLQERKIKRIGENQFRNIDIRIIAATHKDLRKAIKENLFREDLFFRLNVIPIIVPPLRSRKEDIIPLAEFFLKKFAALEKSPVKVLSKKALESLLANPWRGNVRELENAIERAVVLCESNMIQTQHIELVENLDTDYEDKGVFDFKKMTASEIMSIDDLTKQYVQYVLKLNNGAKDKTAKDLKIDRKTLYRKLNEMNQSSLSNQLPI